MATPAPTWNSPKFRLLWLGAKALYHSGVRRAAPDLFSPRLPRYFSPARWESRFRMIRQQLDTCRAIVTISRFHARLLQQMLGVPEELFRVIYFPTVPPSPAYRPGPDRFRPPPRFAWVHRLGREWGPYLLLDSWRRAALSPEQGQLRMYATRGAVSWARSAGFGDLIDSGSVAVSEDRVQGREEQVFREISAVITCPLWKVNGYGYDPFAYQYPVIFPKDSAAEEVYQDGVNGFAFTQGDTESLAGLIRRVAENPGLLEKIAGNNTYKPEYGMEACGEKLLALYREAIGS
jgi:glycosyltransferase involved in cell wall biosynthesis